MFKKICALFSTFSFILAFNAHASDNNFNFSPDRYYGIVNFHLVPSTTAIMSITGDGVESGGNGTFKDFFDGGAAGVELLGGFAINNFLFELGIGYLNHSNLTEEEGTDSFSWKTSHFDFKLAVLYSMDIKAADYTIYPYIGPQIGMARTKIDIKSIHSVDETTVSTSLSGLLYGVKGGIRIPFAEKYLGDIGLSYTRRKITDYDLNSLKVNFTLASFSINAGIGMNF